MRTRLIFTVLISAAFVAFSGDECVESGSLSAVAPAEGATVVFIDAGPGFLTVTGHDDLNEVQATGKACTSRANLLEKTGLVASREEDRIIIEAQFPKRIRRGTRCTIDITVKVPAGLKVEIKDGAGKIRVREVAGVLIDDGSGDIKVTTIGGDVEIEDDVGEISVRGVTGSVTVDDGQDDLAIQRVDGDVVVTEDGSGAIFIVDVKGSVLIENDGTGKIQVEQIGGNFTVIDNAAGAINHQRVTGTVKIPRM